MKGNKESEFDKLRKEVDRGLNLRHAKRGGRRPTILVIGPPSETELRKSIDTLLDAGGLTGAQASRLDLLAREGLIEKPLRDALMDAATATRA